MRYAQSNTQYVLTIRYNGKHLGIQINLVKILVIINVGGNNVIIKQHINILQYSLMSHHLKTKHQKKGQEVTRTHFRDGGKCK